MQDTDNGTPEKYYPVRERRAPNRLSLNALTRVRSDDEPLPREALRGLDAPQWKEAIRVEVQTLKDTSCWTEVKRPSREKVLHSKFVLKRKCDQNKTITKHKARFVVCGNEETENEEESFSSVPDFSVLKLVMSIAKQRGWCERHYDVQHAFPNGKLERAVYVELPKFIYAGDYRKDHVMKLERSMYWLKDAARIWHEQVTLRFNQAGLMELQTAPCIFKDERIMVLCYVYDILMFAERKSQANRVKQLLEKKFTIRDLGRPTDFLGMEYIGKTRQN